jgi:hypothetical protein
MDFKNSLDCVVAFHFPCLSGNTCILKKKKYIYQNSSKNKMEIRN